MTHRPPLNRRLTTAALIALGLSGPAAAETRLPSRFVPGDTTLATTANDQVSPSLCRGGSVVLALWADNRGNSTGGFEGETSRDIYGMRIDGSGAPLDAAPLPIAVGPASQELPRAAWNGTNWLVVYESYDVGGTGYYQKSLEAVRVAPDGHVIDPRPIKIFNDTPVGGTWDVASDGAEWVVVNQSTSSSSDLVASRISADGALLDPSPKSLVKGTYYLRGGTRLEFAGGLFLLAYEESMTGSDPTSAIRFNASLTPLDPAPYGLSGNTFSDMASNGSGFFAVWNEQLPDFTIAVKGSRIGTSGKLLDPAGISISGPNQPIAYQVTAVAWDGSNWRVSWGAADGTRVARVSGSGQLLEPGGVLVSNVKTGPAASAGNGSLQLAWSDLLVNNYDLFTGNVSAANIGGAVRTLSLSAPRQMRPDAALGSGGSMIVYRSSTATRHRVLAQPLDADGNPRRSEPVELDAADSTSYPGYPAVAWNGSNYLVAWNNSSGVVVRRLQPDGTALDPAPILALNPGFGPAEVEALGSDYLVVGMRCGFNCETIYPIATRVRGSDGVVLDSTPIVFDGSYSSSLRLTTLGGRWLLAFQDNSTHDSPIATTEGTFIDASGLRGPAFTIHGPYSTAGGNGIFSIGLASSGSIALMVQSQELTSGVETDLLARFINPDGSVQPMINLTPWKEDQYRPSVAWDGTNFVVAWQDQKTALATNSLEQLDARSDLIGMRIGPSGTIVDPQGFVLSNSDIGEAYPNVVASQGVTLFTASLMRHLGATANYRVGYELLGSGGNSWPSPRFAVSPEAGDVPLSIAFDSSGTSDPGGSIASYLWDFGDGSGSSEQNPTHLYATPGPFLATLKVTDNGGATAMQEFRVLAVAPNLSPVAVAASDKPGGQAPIDITFYASGSYDPDGFIGNIHWEFGDGGEYWGATAFHTFERAGTWPVTLTVFDSRGGSGTTTMSVTIDPPALPTAPSDLTAGGYGPDYIGLTWVDNSYNEDGFTVERCQGNGPFCAASSTAWSVIASLGRNSSAYSDVGLNSMTTYSYRVRAFNVTGDSANSNIATATTPTYAPIAVATASVLHGPAPLAETFDGRGSYDLDGTIVAWNWDFGDGATATGAVVNHTFTVPGWAYTRLTVTDNAGATSDEWVSVEVKDGSARSGASGDAGDTYGRIFSGSYLDTLTQNNIAEVLIEELTTGTPQTRVSRLEHKWSLSVAAGGVQTFYIDAWHTPNTEGDHFIFEYSRDGVSWNAMLTVSKTADNSSLQSFTFPGDVTGLLYVRARDLDRTPGRGQADKLFVDEMYVASSISTGRSGEVFATGKSASSPLIVSKAPYSQLTLSWGPSCMASDIDFAVYQGKIDGAFRSHLPLQCTTSGLTHVTIAMPEGSVYFLVVPNDQYYEGRYGTTASGAEIPAGPTRCWPAAPTIGCP